MKDDKVFLQNILECIVKIETYTNSSKEKFMSSDLIQDAVIRNQRTTPGDSLETNGRTTRCVNT
ncbi:MAG: hypothetical protein P4L49_12815 [Desulfosporosinus sp.]|nr:hypothetical protein [Desulfosporosinus sp.]